MLTHDSRHVSQAQAIGSTKGCMINTAGPKTSIFAVENFSQKKSVRRGEIAWKKMT